MSQYFTGLKSRTDEARLVAARNLQKFVSTELRELPAEKYTEVLDEINQNIFSLMSSPELHEKKGGILAIGKPRFAESATSSSLCNVAQPLSILEVSLYSLIIPRCYIYTPRCLFPWERFHKM